jgi:acyl-CoA synthetase (AMP-forming)/AMP-acid ligase II/acyl carrier protein
MTPFQRGPRPPQATSPAYAEPCIHGLLESQAERIPGLIAIAAPGRDPLTFGGLYTHVESTVHRLNALGLGRNDRVATVLPNGPEMAVAFLAVAAGATSAPLNPTCSEDEFRFYLSDLGARALLVQSGTDSPVRAAAQTCGIPIVELSPDFEAEAGLFSLAGDPRSSLADAGFAGSDDVALVLHTSGTTSQPKIVPLTHGNVCASAHYVRASLQLTEHDRALNVMPLFHAHGLVGSILATLASGGSVVCTPGLDLSRFFEWLDTFRPTWYSAVPTMHQAILSHAGAARPIIARCPLRFIRSCSAPLPPKVMAELESVFHVPAVECYGLTETAHQVTCNPLPPRQRRPGSTGPPTGPEVAILNEAGVRLPPGKTGEIVVRGASVTGGYENDPVANESAFVDGWFRTGDQGRLDGDGYLYITGRIKEIINRGGEKIAPREVDEALLEHPAIAQAAAFAVPHPTLGEDLAAAVVLREAASTTEGEIRRWALARLAEYKVPSQVIILDELPKGPTGKVERMGLAQVLVGQLRPAYLAARDPAEEALSKIWAEVLRIERVGVYDNLFALGGDSLLATQIVSRVQAAFGVNPPLVAIFREPTVAAQAKLVKEMILAQIEELTEEEAQRFAE